MSKKWNLWVIEIKFSGEEVWEPTVGVGLDRNDGRVELINWKRKNPHDRFRLVKYRRTP